jgi:DNA-binding CsgD family transcriptional regulator
MTHSAAIQDDDEEERHALSAFSETVALLYEAQIDATKVAAARQSLRALLHADEIAVIGGEGSDGRPPQPGGALTSSRSNGQVLCIDIGEHEREPVRIQFRRPLSQGPFSEEDRRMLALLRRHLKAAHSLKLLTNRDVFGCLAGAQLAQSMLKGLLIIDADCRIHWRNPAANDILAQADGLSECDGRLCARRAFETSRLDILARRAALGSHGVMLVARLEERHPYGLAFAPVKAGALPARPADGPFVLVTIKEMRRQIKLIAARLGDLFGFSPAEERLGALLLDGHSLREAAHISEKALPTIKTQFRSMLKKTGAHSQAELMNVFLSLPSIW